MHRAFGLCRFVSFLLLGTKWPASPKLAGENDAAAQKQKSADNH